MENRASASARQKVHFAVHVAYVELANGRGVVERDHVVTRVHQLQINKDISGNSLWRVGASKRHIPRDLASPGSESTCTGSHRDH